MISNRKDRKGRKGWRTFPLGELVKFASGGTPSREAAHFWNGDIPWLSAKDLKKFRLNDSIEKVTHEGANNGTRLVEAGNVLILVRGMTLLKDVPVGVTECVVAFNQDLKALIPNGEIDGYYLGFYLAANKFRLLTLVDQAGHGTGRLPSDLLQSFEIELPGFQEQRKIADILLAWDRVIEQTEKLIAAQTHLKRGLMGQLLTGCKRFEEFKEQEWKSTKVSDFAQIALRPIPKPDKPFKSLGIRSHGKGTFLKEDFEPHKIELTELYEVKENDLIANITFAWEGAIAIAGTKDSGALVSHRFPTYVFDTGRVIPEYFRHVIVQKWFVDKLGLISPGSAGRNRVLSKKDFAKIEVPMPSVEEQRRIAAVLNTCDRELDLLRQQLAALKRQKQGLMQNLLTGQVRVKI